MAHAGTLAADATAPLPPQDEAPLPCNSITLVLSHRTSATFASNLPHPHLPSPEISPASPPPPPPPATSHRPIPRPTSKTQVDARKFACPEGVGDALHRFRRNTNDFGYNYCLVLLFISVGCVVTKPFSLIVIACLLMLWAYVFYVRAAEATFRGFTFTLRLQGVILFLFSVFVLLVATDVSQLLTGGLTAGCFACAAHAVMRTPEALPDDGEKGLIGGFTDFVSSSISSNAAAFDKVGDMIPVKWWGLDTHA